MGPPVYCSYKDFEIQIKRNVKHICKHARAIVLAENYGLVTTKEEKESLLNRGRRRLFLLIYLF